MTSSNTPDPSQLTLPYVDTGIEIWKSLTIQELILGVPPVAAFSLAFIALISNINWLFWLTFPTGLLLLMFCAGVFVTTKWYTSPKERFKNWRVYLKRRRDMPWGHDETVENTVHGVKRFRADGTVEMQDGRYVGVIRIWPINTALMAAHKVDDLAESLTTAINEEIKNFDFSLYATTRNFDPDEIVGLYEDRALGDPSNLADDPRVAAYQQELLTDVTEWYREHDVPQWQARDWVFYATVSVSPDDVMPHTTSGFKEILDPRVDSGVDVQPEHLHEELNNRLTTLSRAFQGIDDVSVSRIDAEEHADLLLHYWTGEEHTDEFGPELLESFAEEPTDGKVTTPAERMIAPGVFEATRSHVEVGDQFTKTYWISEWPVEPDSLFLKEVFTMTGVDVDVRLHVGAEDKESVISELGHQIADIRSEGMEREENSNIEAMDVHRDQDAYVKMRELLKTTTSQPWQLTAFVTIRADTEDAIDKAARAMQTFDSAEAAKQQAVSEDSQTVRKKLESHPASLYPILPGTRQLEAFQSGSPTGRNRLTEVSETSGRWSKYLGGIENQTDKRTRVLGGAIGATFPFCSMGIRDPEGVDWGRNTQNGQMIKKNMHTAGAPPHGLGIGQTRAGKTYAASKCAGRWYTAKDDRTLVVLDTQSGFDGLTKLCGGEHIIIDGTRPFNPLHIEPLPENVRTAAGGRVDPLGSHIDDLTESVAGILQAQQITNVGDYIPTVRQAFEQTFHKAGIKPNDLATHARPSPTFADFFETVGEMAEGSEKFTFYGTEGEKELKQARANDLLDRLAVFQENGKYHHLVEAANDDAEMIDLDAADMIYLDLKQLRDAPDAEKSVMLRLMLSQVTQKIKRAPGESYFLIDEAHVLLQSSGMSNWLEKAAREWARYNAGLWFLSQHPKEFVSGGDENASKDVVTNQCGFIQFFRTPGVDTDVLTNFGMNETQANYVKKGLTRGKEQKGYSECLMHFEDEPGWFPLYVEASPFEDVVLNYSPREHGDFGEYLQREWDLSLPDRSAEESADETVADELATDEPEVTASEPHTDDSEVTESDSNTDEQPFPYQRSETA